VRFAALEQRVRAFGAIVGMPTDASACEMGDLVASRLAENSGNTKGSGHVCCFFRRRSGAIFLTQRALVVSTGRNSAWVALDGENTPRFARLRRMRGRRFMPVPGDVVHVRLLQDEQAVVDRVEERSIVLERRTADGRRKTMAANVDLLVTVTSLDNPPPRLVTLDQLLAFADLEGIASAVLFTKPDLADAGERERLLALYRGLGYPSIVIDPKHGANVAAFRDILEHHHAMLAGVSGVGKSTIFRALGGQAEIGEVSRHGLGRQTTSTARLYRREEGFLIDSPGINEFGLGKLAPRELASLFREMREPSARCRFADCSHLSEPGCAVQEAVGQGSIAQSRYASFRSISLGTA
jgi:ribosome biogenesis GTPase